MYNDCEEVDHPVKEKPSIGTKPGKKASCGRDPVTGRFVAGNRNGGRRRLPEELKAAFREAAPEALETLVTIMRDDTARHADRIRCAEIILDRGYGKPAQAIEIDTGEDAGLGVITIPAVLGTPDA